MFIQAKYVLQKLNNLKSVSFLNYETKIANFHYLNENIIKITIELEMHVKQKPF